MNDSITAISGVRVGHWSDPHARTGCTVVLFPAGTVAAGEVRGGAPGTREFDLLGPTRRVERIDAVVLSGGSAFGLAACDGVMRWCEERGCGLPTAYGPVPLVVGMVLFDLGVGDPRVRPTADAGYLACAAASDRPAEYGAVGAGTGATVSKWRGGDATRAGAIGTAAEADGELVVGALVAVNAWGDVGRADAVRSWPVATAGTGSVLFPMNNTTIGVVATNAALSKPECFVVAQGGQDGMARATDPAHATVDGDALVAAATGPVTAPLDQVRWMAAKAVERAVRAAIA